MTSQLIGMNAKKEGSRQISSIRNKRKFYRIPSTAVAIPFHPAHTHQGWAVFEARGRPVKRDVSLLVTLMEPNTAPQPRLENRLVNLIMEHLGTIGHISSFLSLLLLLLPYSQTGSCFLIYPHFRLSLLGMPKATTNFTWGIHVMKAISPLNCHLSILTLM